MHLHSRFSDGMSWPEDISLEAARLGLDLSVTIMIQCRCIPFARACESRGLTTIPACEIDVYESQIEYKSELLAYFPNSDAEDCAPQTKGLLRESLQKRRARLEFLLNSAQELYPEKELSFQDLFKDKTGLDFNDGLANEISLEQG